MSSRTPVAVVGATGLAATAVLASLAGHPMFEIRKWRRRAARPARSSPTPSRTTRASKWFCSEPLGRACRDHRRGLGPHDQRRHPAGRLGRRGRRGQGDRAEVRADIPVISTASAFRYEPDVPVLLPGVNWDHAALIEIQRKKRCWKGSSPRPELHHRRPGDDAQAARRRLRRVAGDHDVNAARSARAAHRASRRWTSSTTSSPTSPRKKRRSRPRPTEILGKLVGRRDRPGAGDVSWTCTRVTSSRGAPSRCSSSSEKAGLDEVKSAWREFAPRWPASSCRAAPRHLISVSDDPFRPQVRLIAHAEGGHVAPSSGACAHDPVLTNGISTCSSRATPAWARRAAPSWSPST